jgi:hypothetical protein
MLLWLAGGKLLGAHRESYILSAELYYGVACLELLAGLGLLTKYWHWLAGPLVAFFVVVCLAGFFLRGDCGCAGDLAVIGERSRILLGSVGGCMSALLMNKNMRPTTPRTPD